MGFFDTLGDIVTAPFTLPIKAATAIIALPAQSIQAATSAVTTVASVPKAAIEAASSTVTSVAQTAGGALQGSVGSLASAAEGIGSSLAMPMALAGGAVLLIMLMKETK